MSELDRILGLPLSNVSAKKKAVEYTRRFRPIPGPEDRVLRPAQAAALHWIEQLRGGALLIGVGGGKCGIALLAPKVLGVAADRVLLLLPAGLKETYEDEVDVWTEEGYDVEALPMASYSQLSRADDLDDVCGGTPPKVVICDEAHYLKNKDAGRTKKFRRYMKDRPDTSLVIMSATLTTKSVFDYAHLFEWALGEENTPLPTSYSRLAAWARILDSHSGGHGTLPPQPMDWRQIGALMDDPRFRPTDGDELTATECARRAFQARLATTPGIVRTLEPSCDVDLSLELAGDLAPAEVIELRDEVEEEYALPNGAEIDDPLRLNAKLRQISQGFYYYWDWEDTEEDREWLYRRNAFSRQVRRVVRNNRRGLDTFGDVVRELRRGRCYDEPLREAWEEWKPYADWEEPPTEPEWFTDDVLGKAIARGQEAINAGHNPIIWYTHRAVAERFSELADEDWEIVGAGEVPGRTAAGLIASVSAHGTGLNLQKYDWNLVLCPPASGATWEQLIGRTHRQGQQRPVHVVVNISTPELKGAWRSAIKDARYLEETQGVPAKILT